MVVLGITSLVILGYGPSAMAVEANSSEPVDVVFLVDGSPSMGGTAENTTASVVEFARGTATKRPGSRFSVVVYADRRWTRLQHDFTADIDELDAGVSNIVYGRNSTENASGAVLRLFDPGENPVLSFRSAATPVVVIFTDEDDDGYCAVGDLAIERLHGSGAILLSVSPETPYDPGQPEPDCVEDGTENDLDTIARERVQDGYWTDLSDPDYGPVLQALDTQTPTPTATPTPTPGVTRTDSSSDGLDRVFFEVTGTAINRSAITLGESVWIGAVVKSYRPNAVLYVAELSNGRTTVSSTRVLMDPGEVHRFEWVLTPNSTGIVMYLVNGNPVGSLEVRPPSNGSTAPIAGTVTPTPTEVDTQTPAPGRERSHVGPSSLTDAAATSVVAPPSETGTPPPTTGEGQALIASGSGFPLAVGLLVAGFIAFVIVGRTRRT